MKTVLACLGAATLASGKVYFSETFDDDWESRWVNSQWQKSTGRKGNFSLAAGRYFKDEQEDRGIQTQWVKYPDQGYFWDTSAAFDSFSNAGKELIVQYQVKYEKDLECGGGYIQLGPKMDQTDFGEFTVFNILFGPDKCGNTRSTRRTRLEFNYKGKVVSKKFPMEYLHMDARAKGEKEVFDGGGDGMSHLYRLVLMPNNTVRVEIDMQKIYEGAIRDEWEGFKIGDPEEHKPPDWADDIIIDDPEGKMPDDWAQKRMVDPAAKKPDDWDAEEDGEWEPPMIGNPAFKGAWVANRIYNEAYKGFWQAKQIDNPEYAGDKEVYKFDDFSYVGFDLWQRTGGAIFDNIVICNDVAEADPFAAQWQERVKHEKAAKIAAKEKQKREEEEAKKKEEAARAKEAAEAAEKAAKREEDMKMGFDDAKLDRLERARTRAKADEQFEANELARKREEKEDKKEMGDEVGKIQRLRSRKAAGRREGALARMRAQEEEEDNRKDAESRGIFIPPDPKKKEEEDRKKALEATEAALETGKAGMTEMMAGRAAARAERDAARAERAAARAEL